MSKMRSSAFAVLAATLLATPAFAAAPLPLTDGIYVKEGVPCKGASNAETLSFWKEDGGINSSQVSCKVKSYTKTGNHYALKQLCAMLRDGGEFDNDTSITIHDAKKFTVESGTYRYCGKEVQF